MVFLVSLKSPLLPPKETLNDCVINQPRKECRAGATDCTSAKENAKQNKALCNAEMWRGEKDGIVTMASKKTAAIHMNVQVQIVPTNPICWQKCQIQYHPTFIYVQSFSYKPQGTSPFVLWVSTCISELQDPGHVAHNFPQLTCFQVVAQQLAAQILRPQCSVTWKVNLQPSLSFLFTAIHTCHTQISFKTISTFLWNGFLAISRYVCRLGNPFTCLHEDLDGSLIHCSELALECDSMLFPFQMKGSWGYKEIWLIGQNPVRFAEKRMTAKGEGNRGRECVNCGAEDQSEGLVTSASQWDRSGPARRPPPALVESSSRSAAVFPESSLGL